MSFSYYNTTMDLYSCKSLFGWFVPQNKRKTPQTTWILVQQTGVPGASQCTSHLLDVSRSLLSTLWSKCRQLHSRTAFTTVSWFYVVLTPRRQRKQKMKRMKPTMAITFHMYVLHVLTTHLNQKYFRHSHQKMLFQSTNVGQLFVICCSSLSVLAAQFLDSKS